MRPALILAVIAVAALRSYAANDGRVVLSREIVPFEADELEAPVWDTDRRSALDDHAPVFTRLAAGVYYESGPDCCRAYALNGDTLVYRGYNVGRHERMLLDGAALSRLVGDASGVGFAGAFSARGLVYDRLPTSEEGSLESVTVASGTIVINGDSIPVGLHREIISSRKGFEGDSVAIPGRTVIYRWLRPGAMHPVALQIEAAGVLPRLFAVDDAYAAGVGTRPDPSGPQSVDNAAIMAVLESAVAVRTASGVEVRFGSAGAVPFDVDVYLIDTTGHIYASARIAADEACDLPVPAAYVGQLFVSVCCAANPELRYKFFAGL